MGSTFLFLVSETILLPFITGLVRLRRIGKGYQPFYILIAVSVIVEVINVYLIKVKHHSNAIPSNIHALLECLLILWQFHVWGWLRSRRSVFWGVTALFFLGWVVENLVLGRIVDFSPYFRFLYAFLVVLLSVNKINFMITHDNRSLLRNPEFLICIAFIIFFIYKIIYEWAYQTSIFGQSSITSTIIMLFGYINALTNIIFAIAFLLIPAPRKFSLR
ncbi:MAG: hypothetical protein JST68_22945 [Bacteroidetes bacterium]|nr:hypothetical protein [Bacteroidota bacterium]